MLEFTSWCFLCAHDDEVDVEIKTLPTELQEKISDFSIVNYNIPSCPSKICQMCHTYLKNLLTLPKRYEMVEKFYIELLKNKSKNVDVAEMKKKYSLTDRDSSSVIEAPPGLSKYSSEPLVEHNEEPVVITPQKQVSPPKVSPVKSRTLPVRQQAVKSTSPSLKNKPKLLNPTILHKIASKSRMVLLSCDKCSHTTSTKYALEKHLELHLTNEKLFECKVCHKKFSRKPILMSHELTHKLSSERKTFQCKECGKHLSSQTAVNTHIKWHHGKREFKCQVCLKDFATKGSLKEHLKIHSDQKQHECPICNKEYKTASTLSNHLDTHSNTVYECTQCGMKLNSKRTLKQHQKVHSDLMEHVCKICGAEFKRTKAYKEHLITHSNIRPYSCEFCHKTFTNGPNCRKHMRETHAKELEEADLKGTTKKAVKLPKIEELLEMSIIGNATS